MPKIFDNIEKTRLPVLHETLKVAERVGGAEEEE